MKSIVLFLISVTIITISAHSIAQLRENDNPGADQPDDSALLGDDLYPAKLESIALKIKNDSELAILDNGYSRHAGRFFGLFLPVSMMTKNDGS